MASSVVSHLPSGAHLLLGGDDIKHHIPDQHAVGDDEGDDDDIKLSDAQEGWVTWLCGAGSSLWPIVRREIMLLILATLIVIVAAIMSSATVCPPQRCTILHEKISHWLFFVAYAIVISIPGRLGDRMFFASVAALGQVVTLSVLLPVFFYVSAFEGAISRLWFLGMTWSLSDNFLALRDSNAVVFDNIMRSMLVYQLLSIARQLALRITMRTVLIGSFEQRIQDVLFQNVVLLLIGQNASVDPATGRLRAVRRDIPLRELLRMFAASDFRRKLDFVSKVRFRMYSKEGEVVPLAKKETVAPYAKMAFKKLAGLPPSVLVEVERKTEQITSSIPDALKGLFSATLQGQGDTLASGVPVSGHASGGLAAGAGTPYNGTPWPDGGGGATPDAFGASTTPLDATTPVVTSAAGTGLLNKSGNNSVAVGGGGGLARSPQLHAGAFPIGGGPSSSAEGVPRRERAGTRGALGDLLAQAKDAVASAKEAVTSGIKGQLRRGESFRTNGSMTSQASESGGGRARDASVASQSAAVAVHVSDPSVAHTQPRQGRSGAEGGGSPVLASQFLSVSARRPLQSISLGAPSSAEQQGQGTLGAQAHTLGGTYGGNSSNSSSIASGRPYRSSRALTSFTFSPPDATATTSHNSSGAGVAGPAASSTSASASSGSAPATRTTLLSSSYDYNYGAGAPGLSSPPRSRSIDSSVGRW